MVLLGRNIWHAACQHLRVVSLHGYDSCPKVEVQRQTPSQHRIAITTNVKPSRPDRAARSFGSSITGSCHSTGWRPMTCAEHFSRIASLASGGEQVEFEPIRTASSEYDAVAVRIHSKSTKRPPPASCDGHESIQGREGAATRQDAEIRTALFASVVMMYMPITEPLPRMLWKMPACETSS